MHPKRTSDGLADLARANEQRRDSALLRATTELFVLDVIHDRDEIRRFEELATHFLPKVSVDVRAFVAERLAICADAPPAVVGMLARDVPDVAAPIIKHSSVLGPVDLLGIIAATGVEHHRLIAKRSVLSPEVSRALRLTGDPAIVARLDGASARTQAAPAVANAPVAPPMPPVAEPEIAAVNGLYRSNRLDPWRFLSLDRKARLRLIADIASRPPPMPYASNPKRLDQAFHTILSAAQIVGYARGGHVGPIINAISEGLGLPKKLVTAAIEDKSGDVFAVMLKALRLDDVQARQVFLLVCPSGRDVKTFFPLSDLYAGMEPTVAETLVEAWRDTEGAGKEGHEPHFGPNSDVRRSAVASKPRQGSQNQDEQARRA